MFTSWADVYAALNIKPDDERMHKVVLQNNEMKIREKAYVVCTLAEASDLIEFERDPQLRRKHERAMWQAISWGECGHIPESYDIMELHKMLFPFGGDYRMCDVLIKGATHVPPPPVVLPMLMRDHADNARWWLASDYEAYYKLAHLHLEFTKIHPFTDGNGRVGRLLLNSHAAYLGLPFIKIVDRNAYIDLLQAEDEQGLAAFFERSSI